MTDIKNIKLIPAGECRWEIPRFGGMRVSGVIYASEKVLADIQKDNSLQQVVNVAHLPGIIGHSLAMPDIHWGYGFPIGGVAAFDMDEGVISPGGVGYDINCGVRLLRTNLMADEVKPRIKELVNALFRDVPTGVGSKGQIRLSEKVEKAVLSRGARWVVEQGYGTHEDLEHTEDSGCMKGADPSAVSKRALERGHNQVGTLGSGNHFVELQVVEKVFDDKVARVLGLHVGMLTVLIHSGSRGLGHQVCDDFIKDMNRASGQLGFDLPDRQLICAPVQSSLGEAYYAAMACAANYAWANRQMLMHLTREAFMKTLNMSPAALGMELIYDVCHNVAKRELHTVDGKKRMLCVHRKGATRAFPAGHPDLPKDYQEVGQPVLVPGDMGRRSFVLVGKQKAMEETFGSTCHGAGRLLSRHQAIKACKGRSISQELENKGIYVRAASRATLEEEVPEAYKNVDDVVEVVHRAGISTKVAVMRSLGVIKG